MGETYVQLFSAAERFLRSGSFSENTDWLEKSLEAYCQKPSRDKAREVYEAFLLTFRIDGMMAALDALDKFEVLAGQLVDRHRDHYMHAVTVFLLGIKIATENSKAREALFVFQTYSDSYPNEYEELLYRWGLTALFHDVGYPLELGYRAIVEYGSLLMEPCLVNEAGHVRRSPSVSRSSDPMLRLYLPNPDSFLYINRLQPKLELANDYYLKYPQLRVEQLPACALQALAGRLSATLGFAPVERFYDSLRNHLLTMLERGRIDHALYGAITFLKWMNEAIAKTEWNPAYFYIPVLDCTAAIALHNVYSELFQRPPFNRPPLSLSSFPLAWLLILCDQLQEFDRLSYGTKRPPAALADGSLAVDDRELRVELVAKDETSRDAAHAVGDGVAEALRRVLRIEDAFQLLSLPVFTSGVAP